MTVVIKAKNGVYAFTGVEEGNDDGGGGGWIIVKEVKGDVL